jgi:hypothetical protein
MILFICYLVGAFAYYQIFCNVYIYKREYGSHDWHQCEKDKNRMWVWILSFVALCMPLFGAVVLFSLYLVLATVGIEDGCLKYKIPENAIFRFLNKQV